MERLAALPPALAHYTLRHACGFDPVPHSLAVVAWLEEHAGAFAPVLGGVDLRKSMVFDLSAGSPMLGADPTACQTPRLTAALFGRMCDAGVRVGVGRYDEARMLYPGPAFASGPHPTDEQRTVHLGLDLFAEAGTPVHAPIEGTVEVTANNTARGDYGPVVILRHDAGDTSFYTLYGHLTEESIGGLSPGQHIARGECFAAIGAPPTNGDYPPHLHLQVITDLLGLGRDFPGVAYPSQRDIFLSLSPDPNLIAQIPASLFPAPDLSPEETRSARLRHLGRNLSLSYRQPLKIVRGWRQYLYDHEGQAYLDAYNNVPLVGHSHPKVVEAAARQLALLNTNTRYLHDTIVRYAERLKSKLPASLSVCYFVNSGSEAVELALRMARCHVRGKDAIVLDHAYHGVTNSTVNMSPHKFNGPGGGGRKPWIHVAPLSDAPAVARIIEAIPAKRGLCAFLAESLPSVAGQIVFPPGYLQEVYRAVHAAGGVAIADEVQTGFGRLGQWFWGFEMQDVVPDIAIFGKAMGNGFPIAGVAVSAEIAASFDNGMEFFSTYGGNPVACAAGLAVLEVLEEERLPENARRVGDLWMESLRELAGRHPVITDVRGAGLFLGVELDRDASYVVNRLRERRILAGADGPRNNVIKLRPPLVFTEDDAHFFVQVLGEILSEPGASASDS